MEHALVEDLLARGHLALRRVPRVEEAPAVGIPGHARVLRVRDHVRQVLPRGHVEHVEHAHLAPALGLAVGDPGAVGARVPPVERHGAVGREAVGIDRRPRPLVAPRDHLDGRLVAQPVLALDEQARPRRARLQHRIDGEGLLVRRRERGAPRERVEQRAGESVLRLGPRFDVGSRAVLEPAVRIGHGATVQGVGHGAHGRGRIGRAGCEHGSSGEPDGRRHDERGGGQGNGTRRVHERARGGSRGGGMRREAAQGCLETRERGVDVGDRDGADREPEPAAPSFGAEGLERHDRQAGLVEQQPADVLVGGDAPDGDRLADEVEAAPTGRSRPAAAMARDRQAGALHAPAKPACSARRAGLDLRLHRRLETCVRRVRRVEQRRPSRPAPAAAPTRRRARGGRAMRVDDAAARPPSRRAGPVAANAFDDAVDEASCTARPRARARAA